MLTDHFTNRLHKGSMAFYSMNKNVLCSHMESLYYTDTEE